MSGRTTAALLATGAVTAVVVQRARKRASRAGEEPHSRWRAVTVNLPPEQVMPGGRVPEPLARLGDRIEVQVAPAPPGRGTELRARLRQPEPSGASALVARVSGSDPRQDLRSALREAKQLLEVGEILRVDPAPHGRRKTSPAGALVDLASRRAGGEGLQ